MTDYAFKLVETQIQKSSEVTVTETLDQFSCSSGGKDYNASCNACTCDFQKQYKLPCKHLFAIRLHKEEELYSEELIQSHWTKAKYLGLLNQTATENQIQTAKITPRKPTSQQERFRKSFRVTQRLASVAAMNTGASFDVKINQLQAILTAWENGQNVVINTIESSGIDIHVNESSKQGSSAPAHTTHDIVTNDSSEDSLHADSPATVAQSADQLQSRDILLPVVRENVDNNHGPGSLNETSDVANLLL